MPVLEDNGDVITESNAIITYIVDKYASDDSLYPKDLYQRTRVNQRLFFHSGTLSARLFAILKHAKHGGSDISQQILDDTYGAFKLLEAFLAEEPYLAGDHITVCDISMAVLVSLLKLFAPLDDVEHPNIIAWLDRIYENVPSFGEINDESNQEIHDILVAKMESNK